MWELRTQVLEGQHIFFMAETSRQHHILVCKHTPPWPPELRAGSKQKRHCDRTCRFSSKSECVCSHHPSSPLSGTRPIIHLSCAVFVCAICTEDMFKCSYFRHCRSQRCHDVVSVCLGRASPGLQELPLHTV